MGFRDDALGFRVKGSRFRVLRFSVSGRTFNFLR